MRINRKKNTVTGILTGIISTIISLLIPFIIRTMFIRILGIEYLGLNSLFSSILQVLNLAELGVGSALVFTMYKPIADDDHEKICALMGLYRKYYFIIGSIVLSLGLIVTPFLNRLISGTVPSDINIYILYLMYLFSSVLSYWFMAYRNSLFQAHQRTDIQNLVAIMVNCCSYTVQIISLLLFKNYYLYLFIVIMFQLVYNLAIALLSKKTYPQYSPKGTLKKTEVVEINRKVVSLFTAKLGTVVHRSFDTIVVSSFLGLRTLAIYQNYYYVITAVSTLVLILFTSMQAGVGNYIITNSSEEKCDLLYRVNFATMLILNICCCCLVNLYQPFMNIWVGKENMLEFSFVILFTISFAVDIIIRPLIMFKDAGGMWKEDRLRPLVAASFNLILNLSTVCFAGLYGIIGSTIISFTLIALPWLILNINRYQFNINISKYFSTLCAHIGVIFFSCLMSYLICNNIIIENGVIELMARFLISVFVSVFCFELIFFSCADNKYYMLLIKEIMRKKHGSS